MRRKNGDATLTVIIIILVILAIAIAYFMFFRNNNTMDDNTNTNLSDNNTTVDDTTNDTTNSTTTDNNDTSSVTDDIEIADANAKALYEKVKNGITLNGKIIEVPATYITRLTDKIKVEGYKMTDDSKKAIDTKIAEIETVLKTEGKDDINDLSENSKAKINSIVDEIEKLL